MFQVLFFLVVILLCFFIVALISVGLCLGIAHLIIYLSPSLDLVSVLVPAAILTVLVMIIYYKIAMFIFTFPSFSPPPDDEEEYDDDDEYHEPTIIRIHPNFNKKKRR
jgi:hypothetical protein